MDRPILLTLLVAIDAMAIYGAVQAIRQRRRRPYDYSK
jgi:hypothetical protein